MLEDYFDKTARIDRLITIGGTNKKEFATHIAALSCTIQPLDDHISSDIPGGFGKNFSMLSGDADIAEGDRVFIASDEYRVIGTQRLSFRGSTHCETIIRIFKS